MSGMENRFNGFSYFVEQAAEAAPGPQLTITRLKLGANDKCVRYEIFEFGTRGTRPSNSR